VRTCRNRFGTPIRTGLVARTKVTGLASGAAQTQRNGATDLIGLIGFAL
jgi:hypothetical protein